MNHPRAILHLLRFAPPANNRAGTPMSWLGLLLIGLAVADLGHSVRPVRWVPEAIAAVGVIVLGLLAGLTGAADLVALAVIAGVVVGWGQLVREGFGRDLAWAPLLLLGVAVSAAILLAPCAGEAGGPLGGWLDRTPWPPLSATDPDRFLLIAGGLLVQCSTGNVVVRLVLSATGTVNPATAAGIGNGTVLKGGRLLGPMERLVILGLGLAGEVTAASLVIAAKGLVRWPEIQSFARAGQGPSITDVTEYFLVGSFVSWLVAFGTLVLLAT